jgi:DedD protein
MKERIVGGLVLLAIVAIFLPLLFHHSPGSRMFSLSTHVPKPPAKPKVVVQMPARTARDAPGKQVLLQPAVLQAPKAWAIQLASFKSHLKAKSLAGKLRLLKYDVYLRNRTQGQGTIMEVYVGPVLRHQQAERLQQKLKQQLHLTGIIRRYHL